MIKKIRPYRFVNQCSLALLMFFLGTKLFAASPATSVEGLATLLSGTFKSVVQIITAISYVGGIGFTLGSIMKFKQHKDNPTQVPVGTPVSMVFIGASLLFFPTILTIAGNSIFGTTTTAGPTGVVPLEGSGGGGK
jgi:intracellular multiplication protein IcmD